MKELANKKKAGRKHRRKYLKNKIQHSLMSKIRQKKRNFFPGQNSDDKHKNKDKVQPLLSKRKTKVLQENIKGVRFLQ